MGDVPVHDGLAIWNTSGTFGAGVVSESMGYAMILAALYDDKPTFDRLSATVQAGIAYSQKNGNVTGLFPWYWTQKGSATAFSYADINSASDADIDIALAYVYADSAVKVYGWSNSSPTYETTAANYIAAIRNHDFSTTDTDANNHVLADGYMQAKSTFSSQNWHPDYSDIRAYQLFQSYDNTPLFWKTAITIAMGCWKAVFNFGTDDKRTAEDANTGPIHPAISWVKLSNATYQSLQASDDYQKVMANRGGTDPQLYTSDSQRLPIRLLNYINAKINSGDADMFGVANANLTALGTSYTNANHMYLVDKENIKSPWSQNPNSSGWIQNFTAAGLFAYASNTALTYNNRQSVSDSLNVKFGSDGINGVISSDLTNQDGFNASLTLWGLTVSKAGETPLQSYILSLPAASSRTAAHDFNADGYSDLLSHDAVGNWAVWLMNGANILSSSGFGPLPSNWRVVGQRDFNGNSASDLLWRDVTTGATSLWFMKGTEVTASAAIGTVPPAWSVVGTGDFDGDGLGDVLWQDTSGSLAIWLMNGASVTSSVGLGTVPMTWSVVATGDFNGDGKADLLWRDTSGDTAIWFMNGTTILSQATAGNVPAAWSIVGIGDFNGDGKADLLWRDTSGDTAIWLMNGAQVSSSVGIGNIPSVFSIALTGDFDGDGKSDLLWQNSANGAFSIWFMNGTQVTSSVLVGTVSPTWTVQSAAAE